MLVVIVLNGLRGVGVLLCRKSPAADFSGQVSPAIARNFEFPEIL